jgi:hypothetical protein
MKSMRLVPTAVALLLAVTAFAGPVYAGFNPPPSTPEIDPGSLVSACALLAGSVLVVADRFRVRR